MIITPCIEMEFYIKNISYGKPENPVKFIYVGTSHKGDTQIKWMDYTHRIIWVTQSLTN